MVEKVNTVDNIEEIYRAKYLIVKLAARWLRAVKNKDTMKAARIRQKSNKLKRDIKAKFDILLE